MALCLAKSHHDSSEHVGQSEPEATFKTNKGAKNGEDDDAKVEVVHEAKDESSKKNNDADGVEAKKKSDEENKNKMTEDHDDFDDDDDDDDDDDHENDEHEEHEEGEEHDEDEEEDPNAKIEIHDLFTPKDCVNKSKAGDLVVIHYKGWMDDGRLFDTTIDPSKGYMPFEFVLGTGTVIKGFERGVRDMCAGQKREIVIPPSLGYGKKGAGEIPGNTTLTYELEMFDIRAPPPQADMFSHIDTNGDKVLSKKEVSVYMRSQAQAQGMPVHDKKWKKHHKMMVANIFEHEDTDEDGSISHDEFSGPKMIYHDEF